MSNIFEIGDSAFLAGAKAIVSLNDSAGFIDDANDRFIEVLPVNSQNKPVRFVPWGSDNNLPVTLLKKAYGNITTASNLDFNSRILFGDSLLVVRKSIDSAGKLKYIPVLEKEAPEIFDFLEENNFQRIIMEAAADLSMYSDAYVELLLNKDKRNPKIVMMRYKETSFSRLSQMSEQSGKIEYHGYSAKWGNVTLADDVIVTPLLDRAAPIFDLKQRLGIIPGFDGKKRMTSDKRFVMSIGQPTPGRFYYNKPFWWSIFKSKWYDFACSIPLFKSALIQNEMVLKYHIKINEEFWAKLYRSEKITDAKKQIERRKQFLIQLDEFLTGKDNAGKSFVSHYKYDQVKGFEVQDIMITPVESFLKGGEYIEDYEEASNAICYAMGVHPSLQGASPGKAKTINGTEARELFIIKQAITKPYRDAIVSPLYAVKAINGWPADIHFVITNIMLTTLDEGTGAVKTIGNQAV
jgi:hypothetical protein